jgi:hypothetical protein
MSLTPPKYCFQNELLVRLRRDIWTLSNWYMLHQLLLALFRRATEVGLVTCWKQ